MCIFVCVWLSVIVHISGPFSILLRTLLSKTMGNCFIVNAPMMFTGVWKIAKGFIDEKTRKKIEVKGGNYFKTLLEYANEDQLPEFLGGSCKM